MHSFVLIPVYIRAPSGSTMDHGAFHINRKLEKHSSSLHKVRKMGNKGFKSAFSANYAVLHLHKIQNHVQVLFLFDRRLMMWTCALLSGHIHRPALCFCWVIYVEINEKQNSWHWPPSAGPQWVISECVLSKAQTNELDWMKAFIKSTLNTVSSVSACRSHSAWLAP